MRQNPIFYYISGMGNHDKAMLLGVAQMSWSDDVFYIEDYDSSAKTATLKLGEAPATADY